MKMSTAGETTVTTIMNKLISLPTEVVLEIRNFLYPKDHKFRKWLIDYNEFIPKENCWSWRNFLSVSNREEWRAVRRDAMIWSLNKHETKKYMEDAEFRAIINLRVDGTKQKIQLVIPDFSSCYSFTQLKTSIDTDCIGVISITRYQFSEFPSCRCVQTLTLKCVANLKKLGSYANLEVLELFGSSTLESIGKMEKLVCLSLDDIGSSCLFPLEQLISFQSLYDDKSFVTVQHRFLALQNLQLQNSHLNDGNSFPFASHGLGLKRLKSLSLRKYKNPNISGLENLTSLSIESVHTLLGKEEILPTLTKLKGNSYFLKDGLEYFPQLNEFHDENAPNNLTIDQLNQCLQLPIMRIGISNGPLRFPKSDLILGEQLRTFQISGLHCRSFQGINRGRYFDEVRLCGNGSLMDVSMFRNTRKVCIWGCSSITRIVALRNVPYLLIGMCDNIRDYSCLGSQHYLEVGYTSHLLDEHLNNFGKVRCLKIANCSRITRVDQLAHNLFINISDCDSLSEAAFYGFDYIAVKVTGCTKLTSVSVHGRIYSFHSNARRAAWNLENCTHVDVPNVNTRR
jgi:hypothetical protein